MLLLFTLYKIPVLIRMKNNQKTRLSNIQHLNISSSSDDKIYIIIIDKETIKGKKVEVDYALMNYQQSFQIPKKVISSVKLKATGVVLLNNKTTIDSYIKSSIIYLETREKSKLEQDRISPKQLLTKFNTEKVELINVYNFKQALWSLKILN